MKTKKQMKNPEAGKLYLSSMIYNILLILSFILSMVAYNVILTTHSPFEILVTALIYFGLLIFGLYIALTKRFENIFFCFSALIWAVYPLIQFNTWISWVAIISLVIGSIETLLEMFGFEFKLNIKRNKTKEVKQK